MKISVITVCFNSEKTIAATIESVLSQTHPDVEHVIVDGASRDRTMQIVKQYEARYAGRLRCISEPDRGIYDAMNKGLALASGDVIAILNSDDFFAGPEALSNVAAVFDTWKTDAVIAGSYHVSPDDLTKIVQDIITPVEDGYVCRRGRKSSLCIADAMLYHGWIPPHTSLYVTSDAYRRYGNFSLKYKVSADLDFMFRLLVVHRASLASLNEYTVIMREGGASTRSLRQYISNIRDGIAIAADHGYRVGIFYVLRRIGGKLIQRLKAKGRQR